MISVIFFAFLCFVLHIVSLQLRKGISLYKTDFSKLGEEIWYGTFLGQIIMDYLTDAEVCNILNMNKDGCWQEIMLSTACLLRANGQYDGRGFQWHSLPDGLGTQNKMYLRWRDQGWGNCKGRVHVVKKGGDNIDPPNDRNFKSLNIV